MSYLVLARKWRPSTFDDVVGQEHVTRTLRNAIRLGRVAHALLFTGSRGVGKTSCARILARALNCVEGPTETPCGVCPACAEIVQGTSVDVFEIDGASNNSVEQIREIRESVKFAPTRGKRKMYIIDEVHMLSGSAFNALLKTLEEPPEHVLFVFATTEPHKIPETILSRCQRYDFKRIAERKIVDALARIAEAEGIEVETAALHHLAREAEGGMRDSLSLLDQVISFCGDSITGAQVREVLGIADRAMLSELFANVLRGDGRAALEHVDQLFVHGIDLQKFAAEIVKFTRDLMVVKICEAPGHLVDVTDAEINSMRSLVTDVDPARIHRLFNAVLAGAEDVARSPYPKLVLEMTLMRLCHQGATLPLSDILDGIARLEARLDDTGSEVMDPRWLPGVGAPESALSPEPAPLPGPGLKPEPELVATAHVAPSSLAQLPTSPESAAEPASSSPLTLVTTAAETQQTPPLDHQHIVAASASPGSPKTNVTEVEEGSMPLASRSEAVAPIAGPVVNPEEAPASRTLAAFSSVIGLPGLENASTPDGRGCVGAPLETTPTPLPTFDDELDGFPVAFDRLEIADDRAPMEMFAELVEQLRKRDGFVATEVEQSARLLRFDRDSLGIAVPEEGWHDLRDGLERLREVVWATVGEGCVVDVRPCPNGDDNLAGETLRQRAQRLTGEKREARRVRARQDPNVRAAVEILDAEIVDILPR